MGRWVGEGEGSLGERGLSASSKGAWSNNRLVTVFEAAGGGGRRGEGEVAEV